MKKILLFAALAVSAVCANAQIRFEFEEEEIPNGGEIYAVRGDFGFDAEVYAYSEEDVTVVAVMEFDGLPTAEQFADNAGFENWGMPQICAGMNCFPSSDGNATNVGRGEFTVTPAGTEYLFHCLFAPDAADWKSHYKVTTTAGTFTHSFVIHFDNTQGGVNSILGNESVAPEYFNLQGQRVLNPAQGDLLIVKQGSKVSKRIIK